MHSTNSMILTILERVRGYLDESVFDAKYDNDFIVNHSIGPCIAEVMARVNMSMDNPVVLRYQVELVAGQEQYQLPANVGAVWRVALMDEQGNVYWDAYPRGSYHWRGPNWTLEANQILFRPFPTRGRVVEVWYTPTGEFLPHYATDGYMMENGEWMYLSDDPQYGMVDRRVNAYAGSTLRLLPDHPGVVEERVIAEHDAYTGMVRVRLPFERWEESFGGVPEVTSSSSSWGGLQVTYEIAPAGAESMYEAISCRAAIKMGAYRNIQTKHRNMLKEEYQAALKTVRDTLSNMQLRTGKYIEKSTVDNPSDLLVRMN